MKERELKSGDLYRHFKNKMYQIVTVAQHSETEEQLVVYQALYGDYKVYARPVGMFLSEVDHNKYPDAVQKYRFEKVIRTSLAREKDEEQANPWLLKFLDTDTYQDKSDVLKEMKFDITDRLINDMAAVLDVVIPEGNLQERYRQLQICIDTKRRYEIGRLQ